MSNEQIVEDLVARLRIGSSCTCLDSSASTTQ